MPVQITQRDLHAQLREQSEATRDQLTTILRPLNSAQLNEHPEPRSWSIAEVIEHLCVAEEAYADRFKATVRAARPDAGAPARAWHPTFLGKLIAGSLEKPRPLKAPRMFQPSNTPRNGATEALLSMEYAFVKSLDDAASLDWNKVKMGTPVFPDWIPKMMNLGDAFRIHVVHVNRHARQIARLAGKLSS
jgi:hypothetical protein